MYKRIVDYLTPLLGEATALNLVRHYCVRMRMSVEDITPGHMSDLAAAMRPMLAVWLGSAGATRVAQELTQLGRGAN
jgi:hypothetical protein